MKARENGVSKHYVEELTEETDMWKWAVKWKEKIVCITCKEEWAEQIAWALDEAHSYDPDYQR